MATKLSKTAPVKATTAKKTTPGTKAKVKKSGNTLSHSVKDSA